MILGTAAYVSPEQAKGKSVDERAAPSTLIADVRVPEQPPSLWRVPIDGAGSKERLNIEIARPGVVSPNGDWIAYSTIGRGGGVIFIEQFPELGGRCQVSLSNMSCHTPSWSQDGSLFCQEGGPPKVLTRVSVERADDGSAKLGKPGTWLRRQFASRPGHHREYDFSPDGKKYSPF